MSTLVRTLINEGFDPKEIAADLLEGRVSRRTAYRWARGDCEARNVRAREVLEHVVCEVLGLVAQTKPGVRVIADANVHCPSFAVPPPFQDE